VSESTPARIEGKTCKGACGEFKPLSEFGVRADRPGGRAATCKACRAAMSARRKPCTVDGCSSASSTRGMCKLHYGRMHRLGTLTLPSRGKPPCRVDGCDRRSKVKGLCQAHYFRLWRYGRLGPAEVSDRRTKPCSVEDCDTLAKGGHGYCSKHYQRVKKYGTPDTPPPRRTGPDHPRWLDALSLSYTTAHKRVHTARGRAKDYTCAGCPKRAAQWSYDHTDPNESLDYRGMPYSADIWRYQPLCIACHKRFDMQRFPSQRMTPEQRRAKRAERWVEARTDVLAAQRADRAKRSLVAKLVNYGDTSTTLLENLVRVAAESDADLTVSCLCEALELLPGAATLTGPNDYAELLAAEAAAS